MWILVITTIQALTAIQNYQIHQRCNRDHQLLWDTLVQQSQAVRDHIEGTNQYLKKLNLILETVGK